MWVDKLWEWWDLERWVETFKIEDWQTITIEEIVEYTKRDLVGILPSILDKN
jgi:hypothetical protein